MLSTALLGMVPASLERLSSAPLWILAGYALAHLFEHGFTSHFHFGEETHGPPLISPGVGMSALAGMTLHAFFDGVTISSSFLVSAPLGLLVALAVVVHKVPEGITIASVMMASGRKASQSLTAAGILAASTLAGAAAMQVVSNFKSPAVALSAGITLYVAASDLVPEVNKEQRLIYSLSGLSGLLFFFLVDLLLRSLGLH